MQYSVLGKTGLKISRVGFGGIPIQQVSQGEADKIIKRAIELGINFIDSARGYNDSEQIIGSAIKGIRDQVIIASKSMAREKEALKNDVKLSLQKFGIDYIELYQMHNIPTLEELDKALAPGGGVEALQELKAQGIIGHIGLTSHSLKVIKKALEYDVFETIQYPFSAVERQAEEVFQKATAKGVGTIAMKPMAGGALRDGRAALKYILENPALTVAIPGMDTIEQVEINAGAADGILLTEEEKGTLLKEASSLGQTFCRRCGYCMPCPKGINIPMVFLMEGYYSRYDLKDWAMSRYNALPKKADACEKCGFCEPKCPYNLPIRDMIENAKNILK